MFNSELIWINGTFQELISELIWINLLFPNYYELILLFRIRSIFQFEFWSVLPSLWQRTNLSSLQTNVKCCHWWSIRSFLLSIVLYTFSRQPIVRNRILQITVCWSGRRYQSGARVGTIEWCWESSTSTTSESFPVFSAKASPWTIMLKRLLLVT